MNKPICQPCVKPDGDGIEPGGGTGCIKGDGGTASITPIDTII